MNPYGVLLRLRRRLYERGALGSRAVPGRSLSVGNMTWGGTGKTPFVEAIARHFQRQGERVAVISRGYGRRSRGLRVVSDGAAVRCSAAESGDEAQLLARRLSGVAVIVCEDRVAGARRAAELGAGFFVFDDAFQHLRLRRDLDVVLLDCARPLGGGLPPRGRAREEPRALAAADVLVLTRCAAGPPGETEREIRRWNLRAPIFHSRFRFDGWLGEGGAPAPDTARPGLAFCAVGSPESFSATLAEAGVSPVAALSFRDHHFYSDADLRKIEEAARRKGAEVLLTTEKDLVKVEGRLRMPVAAARVEPEIRESGFFETLGRLLREKTVVV